LFEDGFDFGVVDVFFAFSLNILKHLLNHFHKQERSKRSQATNILLKHLNQHLSELYDGFICFEQVLNNLSLVVI